MSLHQRLAKLEERTSEGQTVVVWVNLSETQAEARTRVGTEVGRSCIFVGWKGE
jgi:hypothetical protein